MRNVEGFRKELLLQPGERVSFDLKKKYQNRVDLTFISGIQPGLGNPAQKVPEELISHPHSYLYIVLSPTSSLQALT